MSIETPSILKIDVDFNIDISPDGGNALISQKQFNSDEVWTITVPYRFLDDVIDCLRSINTCSEVGQ